jgi:hypothetical protein
MPFRLRTPSSKVSLLRRVKAVYPRIVTHPQILED